MIMRKRKMLIIIMKRKSKVMMLTLTIRAYFSKIKYPGIGRFVKSVLFGKNFFISLNQT